MSNFPFIMNGSYWRIIEESKEFMVDKMNKENEEKYLYVFGITDYPNHIIFLNKEICDNQKERTLMHELTHCYLWEYGTQCDRFVEEEVCNIVSNSHNIIGTIKNDYFKWLNDKKREEKSFE